MSGEKGTKILCCLCGSLVTPNPSNMCFECIKSQYDITDGIQKEWILSQCGDCERWYQPPNYWKRCDLESQELLQICLYKVKRIKSNSSTDGEGRIKLVEAKFVWTEPHSRRVKVKLVVEKELFNSIKLQQSCLVEYEIKNMQCTFCAKQYRNQTWSALVQVRQKVEHQKTFLYIEQLILKHGMQENVIRIKKRPLGLDFYYHEQSNAKKMIHFVSQFCPVKIKTGKRLVSTDTKSNIYAYKRTYSLEIAPICKNDLVCLPKKIQHSLGGLGPIVLCYRVNKSLLFIDPHTLQNNQINAKFYFDSQVRPCLTAHHLVVYTVLDVQMIRNQNIRKGKKKKGSKNEKKKGRKNDRKRAKKKKEGNMKDLEVKKEAKEDKKESEGKEKGTKKSKGSKEDESSNTFFSYSDTLHHHNNFKLCEVQICREDHLGDEDSIMYVKSHLGYILKPGDMVYGYDLENCNVTDSNFNKLDDKPDVILVKKKYKKKRNRKWKVKRILKIEKEEKKKAKKELEREVLDFEDFLAEIEEDEGYRANINIYKDQDYLENEKKEEEGEEGGEEDDEEIEEFEDTIREEELLIEEKKK